jgi:sortase (surface protein transpeptidase)
MGWRVSEVNGVRTTVWVLPNKGAGWHLNSAGAGAAGNVVISGHQLLGDAAFAPIALGDVVAGQEILLTDTEGQVFTYEVIEVSEPLPLPNTAEEEQALAAQYATQTDVPTLTLISGWPDFSSTHRLIVVAELVASDE